MNPKSLIITILVAFVTVWASDFLVHGVLLGATYKSTPSLWRPEAEMMEKMPWMLLGQFLVATAFTMIFASYVAEKRSLGSSIKFAACMGLFVGAGQFIMYAVQPYPGSLVAKWFVAAIVQSVILGIVVHKVYKPAPQAPGK